MNETHMFFIALINLSPYTLPISYCINLPLHCLHVSELEQSEKPSLNSRLDQDHLMCSLSHLGFKVALFTYCN